MYKHIIIIMFFRNNCWHSTIDDKSPSMSGCCGDDCTYEILSRRTKLAEASGHSHGEGGSVGAAATEDHAYFQVPCSKTSPTFLIMSLYRSPPTPNCTPPFKPKIDRPPTPSFLSCIALPPPLHIPPLSFPFYFIRNLLVPRLSTPPSLQQLFLTVPRLHLNNPNVRTIMDRAVYWPSILNGGCWDKSRTNVFLSLMRYSVDTLHPLALSLFFSLALSSQKYTEPLISFSLFSTVFKMQLDVRKTHCCHVKTPGSSLTTPPVVCMATKSQKHLFF
ncbi:unnamed protein product [Oncorhynchus mykiss]|uniref:Uncharacterized protein n=1 Tax=Oncorhynchus mykiss TaxID=8022 RepID=A0A060YLK9_ONCMY|nr:unnamed protein product [Oncorhynchus mykiss]